MLKKYLAHRGVEKVFHMPETHGTGFERVIQYLRQAGADMGWAAMALSELDGELTGCHAIVRLGAKLRQTRVTILGVSARVNVSGGSYGFELELMIQRHDKQNTARVVPLTQVVEIFQRGDHGYAHISG